MKATKTNLNTAAEKAGYAILIERSGFTLIRITGPGLRACRTVFNKRQGWNAPMVLDWILNNPAVVA